MQYDSIVIGAGLSGLSCALLLARSGRQVLVVEQHSQPAPVVRGFRRNGLYFDTGFHYVGGLGDGGAFRHLFRHLGLEQKLSLFPFDERCFDRARFFATAKDYELPVGYDGLKQRLCSQFPQAKQQINSYLDEIEQSWCSFPYLDLDADIADFGMQLAHGESLEERLQCFSAWPELQSLFSMHATLYGVSPGDASTILNSQVAGSYYHSVHGIAGGGKAIIDALLTLLEEAGAEVRCSAEVTSVLSSGGSVSGIRLADGEVLSAREVVATLNPTLLPDLLPGGVLRPAYLKRLRNLRQTCSAYVLFGTVQQRCELLDRSNLFLLPHAGVLEPVINRPLEDRVLYLAAANPDNGADRCGVIAIVPADYAEFAGFATAENRHSADYRNEKQQLADKLRQLLMKRCPELPELETLDFATPLTLADYSNAPSGAIYGVGRFIGQYNPHPATRLAGLYLSGQAIAAPGLLGTVVSAYLTCGTMLGHEALRGEIRKCL